jgi:ADP-ribose pyrophosphatase YjhB (NUDIX family)
MFHAEEKKYYRQGKDMEPKWLEWARQLQSLAQSGLTYTESPFEIERYQKIRDIAAEIMAVHAGVDSSLVRDLFAGEVGHTTPKTDVRGAVFLDDKILLVREKADGLWTLPGGWADVNESPSENVVREIFEESGFRTRTISLLAVYDRNKHTQKPHPFYIYKLFFRCEIIGGEATHSIETDGVDFFPENNLPELSVGRVTHAQIARFYEHYRNPELPADFD